MAILKKDGETEIGRIIDETDDKVVLQPNLLLQRLEIPKAQITERHPSKVSPMPEGLLDAFTEEEVLDLVAYLVFGRK